MSGKMKERKKAENNEGNEKENNKTMTIRNGNNEKKRKQ
jgi:hypothetical protein